MSRGAKRLAIAAVTAAAVALVVLYVVDFLAPTPATVSAATVRAEPA